MITPRQEFVAKHMSIEHLHTLQPSKKLKFSGHQTFAFRYGWLEKGVNAVADAPAIFCQEDALVQLGVGKNMVESIRHWCQLAQLIEPLALKGAQSPAYGLTPVAKKIFLRGGWDRFLETMPLSGLFTG